MFAALLVLLLTPILGLRAESPFSDLSFDEALTKAQREQKIVFIDFFTTWCGPCKKLDASTWKDEAVQKWFAEKTVALKIDAEKEVELAKRFRVQGYPTLLLLKADGSEIDRMVGFRDATKFLSEVEDALAGKDAISRAKEALQGKENDPMARGQYASELARKGRYEEALAEYLWCFDHGKEHNPGYHGVRLSFLLGDIQRLGKRYPPALDALRQRRDAAEARLLDGSVESKAAVEAAVEAIALNAKLDDEARNVELFDRLRAKGEIPGMVRLALVQRLIGPLSKAGRHADLVWLVNNPGGYVKDSIRMSKMTAALSQGKDEAQRKLMEDAQVYIRQSKVEECALVYEALLVTKDAAKAATIGDLLIEFAPTGQTYATLIEAATRAGAQDVAKALAERGSSLPGDEAEIVKKAAEEAGRVK